MKNDYDLLSDQVTSQMMSLDQLSNLNISLPLSQKILRQGIKAVWEDMLATRSELDRLANKMRQDTVIQG